MHHVAAIVLAMCFLGLGSGLLRFTHELEHAHDHDRDHDHHPHDASNCEVHALLNAPLAVTPVVTLLVHLGVFVAFLTLLATPVARLRLPGRIDCRGPPSCLI
jgi:hypothetical protein